MQTINKTLALKENVASWVTEFGETEATPEIVIGLRAKFRFDLRRNVSDSETDKLLPVDINEYLCDSYYFALDGDYREDTDPKLLKTTGITVEQDSDGHVYLNAEIPNTAVPGLIAAVGEAETAKETVSLIGEIGGYNGDNGAECAEFAFQFLFTIRNRVYRGGEVPEEVQNDPEYLTAVQVDAKIAAAVAAATQAPPASLTIGTVESGEEANATVTGNAPNQTLNLTLPLGANGITPSIGENGNWFLGETDTGISATGANGITPSIGENGNWYLGITDTGVKAAGIDGEDGEDGEGIEWDANGVVAEKAVYDDAPARFRFAATVTNSEAKTSTLYIWRKLSDSHADWSAPLAITIFEREKETVILKPIEFKAPTSNEKYLYFNMSAYPKATVAAVCINTDAGELILPYPSAEGITKILKATNGTVYIYFGALVPAYATGRIYLSQMVGLTTPAVDPDIPTPVTGSIYYGYISPEVAGSITSVTQITSDILAAAVTAGTMTKATPATLSKTNLGSIPAGAWVTILTPSTTDYAATKDDGLGGKVAFALDNGATGTGANGTAVTIGSTAYKIYGEFQLVTAEQSIYIDEEE